MQNSMLRSLQVAVAAVAVCVAGVAIAQPAAGDAPKPTAKHHKHKHEHRKGDKRHHHHRGEGGDRDVAAGSSSAREAAAALQADRQGQLTGASGERYANNAVARCAVFKLEEDKRACVDRVANGQGSGSVQGGGILREYTYTVPAKP